MKIIFYQANFCAECGNAIKPRYSWGPRYFCDECEAQMKHRSYFKPLAGLLLCASLAVFALNGAQPPNPTNQSAAVVSTSSAVTSPASSGAQRVGLKPEPIERVLCGARTKKGTPCKRLVLPGQRCAQHRGMASLLESNLNKNSQAMTSTAAR